MTAADPPRQPSRDDRRRVLEAAEEHWNHASGRYAQDFSDHVVAVKLDVPRAWVTEIRDQMFGPDTNDVTEARLGRLPDLERRAKEIEDRAMALAADAEQLGRDVRATAAELAKKAPR